eukprot:jgi/Bigna1/67164/fgenesh1_pg.3_\
MYSAYSIGYCTQWFQYPWQALLVMAEIINGGTLLYGMSMVHFLYMADRISDRKQFSSFFQLRKLDIVYVIAFEIATMVAVIMTDRRRFSAIRIFAQAVLCFSYSVQGTYHSYHLYVSVRKLHERIYGTEAVGNINMGLNNFSIMKKRKLKSTVIDKNRDESKNSSKNSSVGLRTLKSVTPTSVDIKDIRLKSISTETDCKEKWKLSSTKGLKEDKNALSTENDSKEKWKLSSTRAVRGDKNALSMKSSTQEPSASTASTTSPGGGRNRQNLAIKVRMERNRQLCEARAMRLRLVHTGCLFLFFCLSIIFMVFNGILVVKAKTSFSEEISVCSANFSQQLWLFLTPVVFFFFHYYAWYNLSLDFNDLGLKWLPCFRTHKSDNEVDTLLET